MTAVMTLDDCYHGIVLCHLRTWLQRTVICSGIVPYSWRMEMTCHRRHL